MKIVYYLTMIVGVTFAVTKFTSQIKECEIPARTVISRK